MIPVHSLHPGVATAFYGQFAHLYPAQEQAIQPLLNGENLLLSAGTGSGKTEAVVAPIVSRYYREAFEQDGVIILYIAPTKALANDLQKRLTPVFDNLRLTVDVRHGDHDALASGRPPTLLITTPESLDVLLSREEPRLSSLRAVIIDEVHLLYNTQRGLQLRILLQRLTSWLDRPLQWAALSATIGDMDNTRGFLFGPTSTARFLSFAATRTIDAYIRRVNSLADLASLLERLPVENKGKYLIFVDGRRKCEELAAGLRKNMALAPHIMVHYSSLSQKVRLEVEKAFTEMSLAVCIATSTLELGIDIGDINGVILWGPPASVESFLQRIGRGNRRTNTTSVICLVPNDEKTPLFSAIHYTAVIQCAREGLLPRRRPYEVLGAFVQQVCALLLTEAPGSLGPKEIMARLGSIPGLHEQVLLEVLDEMVEQEVLNRHPMYRLYAAGEELHRLKDFRAVYGNFSARSSEISLFHSTKLLGQIPFRNVFHLKPGVSFLFGGRKWRVTKVNKRGVHVEPSKDAAPPETLSYDGGGLSLDPFILDRIWYAIHKPAFSLQDLQKNLLFDLQSALAQAATVGPVTCVPVLRTEEGFVHYTFGGRQVNQALACHSGAADALISDVAVVLPEPLCWQNLPSDPAGWSLYFPAIAKSTTDPSIFQTMLPIEQRLTEDIQPWLRDVAITDILTRLQSAESARLGRGQCRLYDELYDDLYKTD